MGYTTLSVILPHATPYDEAYPTRSMENYSHALHEILQDMEDAGGSWYLTDGNVSSTTQALHTGWIHDMIEDVFDYAASAIEQHRLGFPPGLAKPTKTLVRTPGECVYPLIQAKHYDCYIACMQMCYKIYYMWETEEDPLLLKEKLTELLISWPLTDTEIFLNEEAGQSLRVIPAWKNVDT